MTDDNWVPAGLDDEEAEDYLQLQQGVPIWLSGPLKEWIYQRVTFNDHGYRNVTPDLKKFALAASLPLPNDAQGIPLALARLAPHQLIALTSSILHYGKWQGTPSVIVELREILKLARSVWTVSKTDGQYDLTRVLPAGVQLELERTIEASGSAGQILARAWNDLYGLNPNPSSAYTNAVKAVEIAAHPLIEPNNHSATLGTMNRRIEDPNVPVATVLRAKGKFDQKSTIVRLIDLLWHGHEDRHGNQNYSDVTEEQAKAGLAIATALVSMLTNEVISIG